MPSAQVLHLLTAPPQATPPDPGTIVSATTPLAGPLTTSLLDPAVPAAGAAQVVREYKASGSPGTSTYNYVLSRYLTRPLPAQTIGAGNWKLGVTFRNITTLSAGTLTPGYCVAQWRPGTGVIARALDNVAAGTTITGTQLDIVSLTTVAGSSLTFLAGDCLIVEVWMHLVNTNGVIPDFALLLNGLGQFVAGTYLYNSLTDTDAVLVAPAAITFS